MRGAVNTDDEALAALESVWYEVIDAVMAGRTQQLACPQCHAEGLVVEQVGERITVVCRACQAQAEFQNTSY